jgi:hypothetical protein
VVGGAAQWLVFFGPIIAFSKWREWRETSSLPIPVQQQQQHTHTHQAGANNCSIDGICIFVGGRRV